MSITPDITPCLCLDTQAEEAPNFYTGIFPNSPKSRRAFAAMMQQKKPDIATMQRAYDQHG